MRQLHVVPNPVFGWVLVLEGRRVGGYRRKRRAMYWGRALAIALQPCELVPHNRRGQIVDAGRATYPRSADPRDIPG